MIQNDVASPQLGTTALRLALGARFLVHGLMKVFGSNPWSVVASAPTPPVGVRPGESGIGRAQ